MNTKMMPKCGVIPSKHCSATGQPNVVQNIEFRRTCSDRTYHRFYRTVENYFCPKLRDMRVTYFHHTCDRRITEIATHHNKPIAVSGTKGGAMTLHDIRDEVKDIYSWEGRGPGNSVLDIKFPYHQENKMLTASLDCSVKLWDLERLRDKPCYIRDKYALLDTNDYLKWYCSIAPSPSYGLTVAGCNKGFLTLLDKDYQVISRVKVHKSKINSLDFNMVDHNLLVTASLDKCIKFFDTRNLDKCLTTITHCSPFNTATFSRMNGRRVLASDQHSDIHLYNGPLWNLERVIKHPHRQFQHLTPIRASWHPYLDLIVIGRYPDKNVVDFTQDDLKSVDIFSADTGDLKVELVTSSVKPIITSISEFSFNGDVLVTGTGSIVLFWRYANIDMKLTKRKNLDTSEPEEDGANETPPSVSIKRKKKK